VLVSTAGLTGSPEGGASSADAPRSGEQGSGAPASGAVWRHDVPGRGLDANVIHLPPGRAIGPHDGPALDVLWHVVSGDGTLLTADGEAPVRAGDVVHLPRGSRRGVRAGESGLTYLTVHARKPGLGLGPTR
jgi:quercetin dioxygenase-like cupin family protein